MARLVLTVLLVACAAKPPPAPSIVKVEIVKLPEIGSCWLPDMPEAPEQAIVDRNEDVMKRMWIHRREFEELLEYMRWWRHWATYIQGCLKERLNIP